MLREEKSRNKKPKLWVSIPGKNFQAIIEDVKNWRKLFRNYFKIEIQNIEHPTLEFDQQIPGHRLIKFDMFREVDTRLCVRATINMHSAPAVWGEIFARRKIKN